MRIAVTTSEPLLNAAIDGRFGRCSCFLIVGTEDLSVEAVENPYMTFDSDAGIQSAQLMAEKGVEFVLTGNCGPRAHQSLSTLGIGVILGCSGVAREVVEQFKKEQGPAAEEPNVPSGFGASESLESLMHTYPHSRREMPMTDKTRAAGSGDSGGRGQKGSVVASARETEQTWPPAPMPPEYCRLPPNQNKQQQLEALRCRAKEVRHEMQGLRERIRQLQKELQT